MTDLTARMMEGLEGRLLTDQEIEDQEREDQIDFDDPQYLYGQVASALAERMER